MLCLHTSSPHAAQLARRPKSSWVGPERVRERYRPCDNLCVVQLLVVTSCSDVDGFWSFLNRILVAFSTNGASLHAFCGRVKLLLYTGRWRYFNICTNMGNVISQKSSFVSHPHHREVEVVVCPSQCILPFMRFVDPPPSPPFPPLPCPPPAPSLLPSHLVSVRSVPFILLRSLCWRCGFHPNV